MEKTTGLCSKLEGNASATVPQSSHPYIRRITFAYIVWPHICVSCKWTASTKWIIKLYSTNPCREVLHSLASIYMEARVQDRLRAAPRERIQWLAREDLNKAASCWQRGVHIVHFPVTEHFRYLRSAFSTSKPPSVKRLLDESLSVNYLPLHHVSPSTGVLSVDMSGNFVYKFSVLETAHRR